MVNWVKCHSALTKGAKRALSRATRFLFLELCLEARESDQDGAIEIRPDLDLPAAVYDLIGGNLTEIAEAVGALTAAGMIEVRTTESERFIVIPSWDRWNRTDTSTDRVKRHRATKRDETPCNVSPVSDVTNVNALEERRGEEKREEEKRTPPPPAAEPEPAVCAKNTHAFASAFRGRPDLFGADGLDATANKIAMLLDSEPKADGEDRQQLADELIADAEAYAAKYSGADTKQRVARLIQKATWILGDIRKGSRKAPRSSSTFARNDTPTDRTLDAIDAVLARKAAS